MHIRGMQHILLLMTVASGSDKQYWLVLIAWGMQHAGMVADVSTIAAPTTGAASGAPVATQVVSSCPTDTGGVCGEGSSSAQFVHDGNFRIPDVSGVNTAPPKTQVDGAGAPLGAFFLRACGGSGGTQ